jgi:18S rRNA (guanine1575-N7)-methyltransferase
MLTVAAEKESEVGDLVKSDIGQGLPFRPATFDGAISISAIQWLCYSNATSEDPKLRLNRFFASLYSVLRRDARAVLQFYPESSEQAVVIAQAASRVGFAGGYDGDDGDVNVVMMVM